MARWKEAILEKERNVSSNEGEETAKRINAGTYIECSSLNKINLDKVFNEAIKLVFEIDKINTKLKQR